MIGGTIKRKKGRAMSQQHPRRSHLLHVCSVVLAISIALALPVQAQPQIYSDKVLIEWAHDTYERHDWIYAAGHLNALIQRNPPQLRDHPTEAKEAYDAWVYTIKQLESDKAAAAAWREYQARPVPGQPARTSSGLTQAPPSVNWSVLMK
jgi:hypothetical protein